LCADARISLRQPPGRRGVLAASRQPHAFQLLLAARHAAAECWELRNMRVLAGPSGGAPGARADEMRKAARWRVARVACDRRPGRFPSDPTYGLRIAACATTGCRAARAVWRVQAWRIDPDQFRPHADRKGRGRHPASASLGISVRRGRHDVRGPWRDHPREWFTPYVDDTRNDRFPAIEVASASTRSLAFTITSAPSMKLVL